MFLHSINQRLFKHFLNTVSSSGVLNKDNVGLEKVQGVAPEWEGRTKLAPFGLKGRQLRWAVERVGGNAFQHEKYGASNNAKKNQSQDEGNNYAASKRTAKLTDKGYC